LRNSERVGWGGRNYTLLSDVPAKHKFAACNLAPGDGIYMYGVLVGRAVVAIREGELISTRNIRHDAAAYRASAEAFHWQPPDVAGGHDIAFLGYGRANGEVGTRNYWIVLPLVFCENRNLAKLKEAFEEELGFAAPQIHRRQVADLVNLYREGRADDIAE